MSESKFEVFVDSIGKFRFRIRSADGQVISESEAYQTKEDCLEGIKVMKHVVPHAIIEDRTEHVRNLMPSMKPMEITLETLRLIDLDGEIIAQKNQNGSITLYEVVK
jgi:uncharacterized protein YegP (UPF0339 family)